MRFCVACVWNVIEASGVGPACYRLPFPRNKTEVTSDPRRFFSQLQSWGAIPPDSRYNDVRTGDHDIMESGKSQRVFLCTVRYTTGQSAIVQEQIFCVKTGRLRAPITLRLALAVWPPIQNECGFYEDVAPMLPTSLKLPVCYHTDSVPLLVHTFLLLEGLRETSVVTDAVGVDSIHTEKIVVDYLATFHASTLHCRESTPIGMAMQQHLGPLMFRGLFSAYIPARFQLLTTVIVEYNTTSALQALNHADPRMGNFLWYKDTSVTLVDWEGCAVGPACYDLLYHFWICRPFNTALPNMLTDEEVGLAETWLEAVAARGHPEVRTMRGEVLFEQMALAALLLSTYIYLLRIGGFMQHWEGGNDLADMIVWTQRFSARMLALRRDTYACDVIVRALDRMYPDRIPDGDTSWKTMLDTFLQHIVN
jgi:hypothetical protein